MTNWYSLFKISSTPQEILQRIKIILRAIKIIENISSDYPEALINSSCRQLKLMDKYGSKPLSSKVYF